MNRWRRLLLLLLGGSILMCSCRKDLCYDHDMHGLGVRLALLPEWEQEWERDYGMSWQNSWPEEHGIDYDELRPSPATGIATFVYHEDSSYTERHVSGNGGVVPMSEGEKQILLYNNDTRYIIFDSLHLSSMASASTRVRSRSTYSRDHSTEKTISAPDMLYGAWIDSYTATAASEPDSMPVTMRPLVYTYLIRYEFEAGLQHVTQARGALSGMAESVYLQDGRTGDNAATILFDCELKDYGAEVTLASFGLPSFPGDHYVQPASKQEGQRQMLNLEVMLKNGTLKNFDLDVTDQLATQPRGGVIKVSGLVVTDEEAGSDAGFEVEVDGWGEYEDIELPLN